LDQGLSASLHPIGNMPMATIRYVTPVLALILLFSVAGCCKSVAGIYVHEKDKTEFSHAATGNFNQALC
jgi:hypothetical protein